MITYSWVTIYCLSQVAVFGIIWRGGGGGGIGGMGRGVIWGCRYTEETLLGNVWHPGYPWEIAQGYKIKVPFSTQREYRKQILQGEQTSYFKTMYRFLGNSKECSVFTGEVQEPNQIFWINKYLCVSWKLSEVPLSAPWKFEIPLSTCHNEHILD